MFALALAAMLVLCATGCSKKPAANHGAGSPAAAEPTRIDCFTGAKAYRFGGQLSLTGASSSSQIGSLANLLTDVRFRGAYLAPNSSSIDIAFPGASGSQDLSLRRVNGQLYQSAAGGRWQTSTGQGPIISTISRLDPQSLCQDSLAHIDLAGKRSTVESVNGTSARHYTLGPADLAGTPGLLGRGAEDAGTPRPGQTPRPAAAAAGNSTLDVWVNPANGYPVRMKLAGSPEEAGGARFSVSIDVTDVNGADIAIPAPTP